MSSGGFGGALGNPPRGFWGPLGGRWGPSDPPVPCRGAARYEFTHEILPDEESFFGELRVPRGRRVALIFRNDPPGENPPNPPPGSPEPPWDPSQQPHEEGVVQ